MGVTNCSDIIIIMQLNKEFNLKMPFSGNDSIKNSLEINLHHCTQHRQSYLSMLKYQYS